MISGEALKWELVNLFFNKIGKYMEHPLKYDHSEKLFYKTTPLLSYKRWVVNFITTFKFCCEFIFILMCLHSETFSSKIASYTKWIVNFTFVLTVLHLVIFYSFVTLTDSLLHNYNDVMILKRIFKGS